MNVQAYSVSMPPGSHVQPILSAQEAVAPALLAVAALGPELCPQLFSSSVLLCLFTYLINPVLPQSAIPLSVPAGLCSLGTTTNLPAVQLAQSSPEDWQLPPIQTYSVAGT